MPEEEMGNWQAGCAGRQMVGFKYSQLALNFSLKQTAGSMQLVPPGQSPASDQWMSQRRSEFGLCPPLDGTSHPGNLTPCITRRICTLYPLTISF